MLVIHAVKCMMKDEQGFSHRQERQCRVEHCNNMKMIFRHAGRCKNRGSCNMGPNCYYTDKLVNHWNDCSDEENCPVCGPAVRKLRNDERRAAADRSSTSGPSSRSYSDPVQLTSVHYGVACNGCQTGPIKNIRYLKITEILYLYNIYNISTTEYP